MKLQWFLYHRLKGGRRLLRLWFFLVRLPYRLREFWLQWSHPDLLENYEQRLFSQHGEDGMLAEIMRRLGIKGGFFVEFGVEHGEENNTLYLAKSRCWKGLWIEGVEKYFQAASNAIAKHSVDIKIIFSFVTRENILEKFEQGGVPLAFELLSVDIDGNDYWILSKILEKYRPRVIVTEYNACHDNRQEYIIDYRPDFIWDGSNHYGANLLAFNRLAEKHGYKLVGCDKSGANAFLVREDCLQGKFLLPENPVEFFYRVPKYNIFFGYPAPNVLKK